MKKNELKAVNDALQYWKGFHDGLMEVESKIPKGLVKLEQYKDGLTVVSGELSDLIDNAAYLIEDYKKRYHELKRESTQSQKERHANEGRKKKNK